MLSLILLGRNTHPSVTHASSLLLFQHESFVLGLAGLAFTTNRINYYFDGLIFNTLTLLHLRKVKLVNFNLGSKIIVRFFT